MSELTKSTAPVVVALVFVPYPIATTSWSITASSFNFMFRTVFPPTSTFSDFIPIKEKIRFFPLGTAISYLPSMSEIVPVVVPSTITETPGIGLPSKSSTTPCTTFCCAHNGVPIIKQIASRNVARNLFLHADFIIN